MAKYSDLIGNSRTENSPIRSVCIDPVDGCDTEDGIITFLAEWCEPAKFDSSSEDGDIVTYTPFWPKNDRVPETFVNISGTLTEDGIVLGFPGHWTGYPFA